MVIPLFSYVPLCVWKRSALSTGPDPSQSSAQGFTADVMSSGQRIALMRVSAIHPARRNEVT